jgi:hypothetical protein
MVRRHMAVFSIETRHGERAYACPRPNGRLLPLVYSDRLARDALVPPPALDITGTNVAWAVEGKQEDGFTSGRITLIRSAIFYPKGSHPKFRGWYAATAVAAGKPKNSQVGSLVGARSGATAWIACPPRRRGARRGCRRPGRRDTVYVLANGSTKREVVARGRDIDPSSLTRRGNRIFWLQGGSRRSARLPPS